MGSTFLLGVVSICYLLLYRYRLQELAQRLKNAGRSREVASGPLLALVIHLLALLAFVVLAWTLVALIFFR